MSRIFGHVVFEYKICGYTLVMREHPHLQCLSAEITGNGDPIKFTFDPDIAVFRGPSVSGSPSHTYAFLGGRNERGRLPRKYDFEIPIPFRVFQEAVKTAKMSLDKSRNIIYDCVIDDEQANHRQAMTVRWDHNSEQAILEVRFLRGPVTSKFRFDPEKIHFVALQSKPFIAVFLNGTKDVTDRIRKNNFDAKITGIPISMLKQMAVTARKRMAEIKKAAAPASMPS